MNRWKVRVKLKTGNGTAWQGRDTIIEARSSSDARKLAEAQYGKGSVLSVTKA